MDSAGARRVLLATTLVVGVVYYKYGTRPAENQADRTLLAFGATSADLESVSDHAFDARGRCGFANESSVLLRASLMLFHKGRYVWRSASLAAPAKSRSSWQAASLSLCKHSREAERTIWLGDSKGGIGRAQEVPREQRTDQLTAKGAGRSSERFAFRVWDSTGTHEYLLASRSHEERG